MKKIFAMLIMMSIIVTPVYANSISLGVSPSGTTIILPTPDATVVKRFHFVNPHGTVDAMYTVVFENEMDEYVDCSLGGLCNNDEFLVPMGTDWSNTVGKDIHFVGRENEEQIDTGFYIYGRPIEDEDDLEGSGSSIEPRILVKVSIEQYLTPPTTSTTTSTTTTTTPTTTTSQATTTTSGSYFNLPSLFGDDTEDTVDEQVEVVPIDEDVISDDIPLSDSKEQLEEKIKKDDNLNFSEWILLPVIGCVVAIVLVAYYMHTKNSSAPAIPKWKYQAVMIVSMLLLPTIVIADDITISATISGGAYCGDDVCQAVEDVDSCYVDCASDITRTLVDIGSGSAGMFNEMSSPIAIFIILMGVAVGISIIFKSIFVKYLDFGD